MRTMTWLVFAQWFRWFFAKYMTYIGSTMIAESYTGGFRIGSLIDETNIIKSIDLWATGFRRLMNGIY